MYGLEATDWFIISCKFSCFCAVAILKLFVVNHIPGLILAALRFNKLPAAPAPVSKQVQELDWPTEPKTIEDLLATHNVELKASRALAGNHTVSGGKQGSKRKDGKRRGRPELQAVSCILAGGSL